MAYTTHQIARAAGVTYRQLDYWCRHGLVAPSIARAAGQGSRRQWAKDDLVEVRRVAAIAEIRRQPLANSVATK